MKRLGYVTFGALALLAAASRSDAVVFNFSGLSGVDGTPLAASASFTVVGGTTLEIVLTNTAAGPATDPSNTLAGLFFNIAGSPTVVNGTAALNPGSGLVLNNAATSGNDLNDEWMYGENSNVFGDIFDIGFGATGFAHSPTDTFRRVFTGSGPSAGATNDYAIVPLAGTSGGGANSEIYVQDAVLFTLTLGSAITEDDISNVIVSYGSSGSTVLVPEPATLGIMTVGALALIRRRRRN